MTQTVAFPEEHFRHSITPGEFQRMSQAGVLPEGVRFELLEGEIYQMDAMDDPHAGALRWLDEELREKLRGQMKLAIQVPLVLSNGYGEPEPDLMVLTFESEVRRKPRVHEVLAVIEISDSSLNKNRRIKQRVYTRAGIPECWIVNVNDVQLEIYRNPGAEAYKLRQTLERGELAQFAAFPEVAIQWW